MGSPGRLRLCLTLAPLLLLIAPAAGRADDGRCAEWVARVVSVQGPVEARLGEATAPWRPVALESRLCAGDTLRVQANGRAAIELRNETVVRLDQHTTLTLGTVEAHKPSWLELLKGAVHFITRTPRSLEIRTPYVNAAVEGTEFQLRVTEADTRLWVYEGRVLATNDAGSQRVASGQALVARAGAAPEISLELEPQDAVRWTLYYPVVVDFRPRELAAAAPGTWQHSTAESLGALEAGDAAGALDRALAVTQPVPDARFYTYRASLLLSVGRVDAAADDLARARARDAGNASALAVEAIVALAGNDQDRADDLARRAIAADGNSAAALLALSYAQQARFDLDAALASARRARQPGPNAIADARVAELLMATGEVRKAKRAARAAAARSPASARAHAVLGFAHLANMRAGRARAAFQQAIRRDSADPLARLGLGLARIRTGDLEAGRREIEIAAALDPANALVRSYLGKTYYEEGRDRVAAEQLAMAKRLDPKDPTPWLHDALRKQSENRPVEALQDLQQSVALNDNRAVYRSRLLLDQDLAMRSAGLGRVYGDLGLQQLALLEGWRSLETDPANFSAHRLLADAYAARPRHEIARVSELLQAQLLQPINVNPLQPQQAEGGLGRLPGAQPAELPADDFSTLLTRDRVSARFSAMGGDYDTHAENVIVSGIQGPASFSVGAFRYQTAGVRENNDLDESIYNAFVQVALSHNSSLQAEYRHSRSRYGDLSRNFDYTVFSDTLRTDIGIDSYRLGYRLAPTPRLDLIFSGIYQEKAETTEQVLPGTPPPFPPGNTLIEFAGEPRSYQIELQSLWRQDAVKAIVGAGHYREEHDRETTLTILPAVPPPPVIPLGTTLFDEDAKHANAYVYLYYLPIEALTVTLGASYDSFEDAIVDRDQINPKLGLSWEAAPGTRLRLGAFRVMKRAILADQSIEPTQVAGFNQLLDEGTAADTRHYGLALDQHLGRARLGRYRGVVLRHQPAAAAGHRRRHPRRAAGRVDVSRLSVWNADRCAGAGRRAGGQPL
jgi:tetratricopeptide (TPR) repeat protein